MSIDIASFTPGLSLTGGLVIGAAAAVLVLFNGRIAGISGILGGLLSMTQKDAGWRVAFLALPSHGGAPDRWFSPGIYGRKG